MQLLTIVIDSYADRDYTLNIYYIAEVLGGHESPGDDLAQLRWFAPTELPDAYAFTHCSQVPAAWRAM